MNLPLNQYKRVALPDADTDPYGLLEYCIGSGDDFHCLDYAIFPHEGKNFLALHSVINSETGAFIQDASYSVLDISNLFMSEGEELLEAANLVSDALDWCAANGIKHSKTGWNQDPFYFVRALARDLWRHGIQSEGIAEHIRDARAFRFGGAKLNREIHQSLWLTSSSLSLHSFSPQFWPQSARSLSQFPCISSGIG